MASNLKYRVSRMRAGFNYEEPHNLIVRVCLLKPKEFGNLSSESVSQKYFKKLLGLFMNGFAKYSTNLVKTQILLCQLAFFIFLKYRIIL